MNDPIRSILSSALLRALQVEPTLTVNDGIERVRQLVPANTEFLKETGKQFRRRGILNPNWLSKAKKMGLYFYLVNAQPGWFHVFAEQTSTLEGLSNYILYGLWDSLIVLHGSEEEASQLLKNIEGSTYVDLAHFSASRIPFFYGHKTREYQQQQQEIDFTIINALVDDYDNPELKSQKMQMAEDGIFLGSILELGPPPVTDIIAFVGIRLGRGSHALRPEQVLDALLQDETLRTCMVHLVEIDRGYPFNYLAKLVCQGRDELDRATDAIADCRVGMVTLEGNTSVVARGKQAFPKVSMGKVIEMGPSPDLRQVEDAATKMLIDLGTDTVAAFNALSANTQLVVLRSLDELSQQRQDRCWDDESHERIQNAYVAFARASIVEGVKKGSMVGPVVGLATDVERSVQKALRHIIEVVYSKDTRRAQNELKLPTRDISRVSLGKAVVAFRTMKTHDDFKFISADLDDNWLKRLERFAEARNIWAHTGGPASNSQAAIIDEGRRVLVEGIEIIRWVCMDVLKALERHLTGSEQPASTEQKGFLDTPEENKSLKPIEGINLKPRGEREIGIFLSHSSKDVETAIKIAEGLRAMDYEVWYADWAIGPSDSIVEKIYEALAKINTLIVLLSENSAQSKWVKHELNTALMKQLSGQAVAVLPILIEDCEISDTLQTYKYIDMRPKNFKKGFIELFEFLRKRFGE